MKTKLFLVAAWFAILPFTFSCTQSGGVEKAEEDVILQTAFSNLSDKGITSEGGLNVFSLEASDQAGNVLALELLSDLSFLPSGNYAYGDGSTYVFRNAVYCGSPLTGGSITVTNLNPALKEGQNPGW